MISPRVGALIFALLTAGLVPPALAAPWPQAEGQGFLIDTLSFVQADNHAGIPNPAYGNGTFRHFDLGSYLEYGLTNETTLGASAHLQLRQLETDATTLNSAGVGDIELFARPTVWRDESWIIAVQGLLKVPTGYSASANPRLGDGQVDLEPRLLVGRGFMLGRWPAFADVECAYRFRFGSPSDQVRGDAIAGVHVRDDWMILVQSYNIVGLRNEKPGGTDFDLSTVTVSVVHDLSTKWAAQVGALSEVHSRNYNTGNGGFVAVWRKF